MLRQEIRARLDSEASSEVRASFERLVPGARILGVRVPVLRALSKEYGMSYLDAVEYLDAVAPSAIREEMLFAVFSLAKWKKPVAGLAWERMARWIRVVDNWEVCDQMGSNVVAAAVHAQPVLEARLFDLAESANMWERRMALATAAAMNQRGRLHSELTERLCAKLAVDREAMIRKCVGWARRELAKATAR